MIKAGIVSLIFFAVFLAFCCLIVYLFKYHDHVDENGEKSYVLPIASIGVLFIVCVCYSQWRPTDLFVIEDGRIANKPSYSHYYVISNIELDNKYKLGSESSSIYIYNCSEHELLFEKHTYGYRSDNSSDVRIRQGELKKVSAIPDYFFENAPYSVLTKQRGATVTKWSLNICKESSSSPWKYPTKPTKIGL